MSSTSRCSFSSTVYPPSDYIPVILCAGPQKNSLRPHFFHGKIQSRLYRVKKAEAACPLLPSDNKYPTERLCPYVSLPQAYRSCDHRLRRLCDLRLQLYVLQHCPVHRTHHGAAVLSIHGGGAHPVLGSGGQRSGRPHPGQGVVFLFSPRQAPGRCAAAGPGAAGFIPGV